MLLKPLPAPLTPLPSPSSILEKGYCKCSTLDQCDQEDELFFESIAQTSYRIISMELHWNNSLKYNFWPNNDSIITYSYLSVAPRNPNIKIISQSSLVIWKTVCMFNVVPFQEKSTIIFLSD